MSRTHTASGWVVDWRRDDPRRAPFTQQIDPEILRVLKVVCIQVPHRQALAHSVTVAAGSDEAGHHADGDQ